MQSTTAWLVIIVQMPLEDPAARMLVLRTLEALGAAVMREGAYLLPETPGNRQSLDTLATRYEDFLQRFKSRRPVTPEDSFVGLTELVHAWRAFPFLDPELPENLYGGNWIGRRAIGRFHELRDRWRPGALKFWKEIAAEGEGLATRDPW